MTSFPVRVAPRERLLLFARVPRTGEVKTRLARELGDERALAAYNAMLQDLLEELSPRTDNMELEILWTADSQVSGSELTEAFGRTPLAMQTGDTLGDRLAVAFSERIFFHGTDKVIAIGVDEPTLSGDLIAGAFALLDSCEYVLGPATDGGYYLIGCRSASFRADVFREVAWGTPSVLAATMEKVRSRGATMAFLPERRDVDEVEDLRAIAGASSLPPRLSALLEEWGWR